MRKKTNIPKGIYQTAEQITEIHGSRPLNDLSWRCHGCRGGGGMFRNRASHEPPGDPVQFVTTMTSEFSPVNENELVVLGFCEKHADKCRAYVTEGWKKTTPEDMTVLRVMSL